PAVLALTLIAIVVSGCGRNDFQNDPRPPIPAEISAKIATDGIVVSPRSFGAGLAVFTVANLTNQAGSLAIHGPVTAATDEIPPSGTGSVNVQPETGTPEARRGGAAGPAVR